MSVNFRYPNITGRTEREQLDQMKSYMYQMVDQLNYAMHNQSGSGQTGTDIKNGSEAVGSVATEKTIFLKAAYPIGAVYISTVATSPKTLFGFGTWERIQDRFLLAAGSSYGAGSTGGEATHTLTVNEMPSHSHDYHTAYGTPASEATENGKIQTGGSGNTWVWNQTGSIVSSGGGAAHNNMPPYLAVYVWQRTA